jgi:pSer/pThr/pTyr-binding forkhead associated (FHA) protein
MTDQLLTALKILLLALIYLFFARVLWAVWSEVRTPVAVAQGTGKGRAKKKSTPKGASVFVVIEPKQHRGRTYTLSNALAIGRLDDNDIIVEDDTFISSHHARLEIRPEGVWVVDLQSTNGSFVNGQRLTGERSVRKGDRIQVGSTVLEMRS